jgi:hypothetical protein
MSVSPRQVIPVVASLLPLFVLAACGGGGGGSTTPPPTATVTIGGTVAGLVGTVVLQNNAGDNLSVTANGSFAFATAINKGSAYAVTVLKQPSGPSCTVASGSGTANDNVSNVSVTCTVDPATAYLPLTAFPATGDSRLMVISTKAPGDTPIQVVTERTLYMASLRQSNGSPYAGFYTTFHTDGSNHLWSLSLTGNSTLVPTQVSNLTLPYYTYTIGGHLGQHFFCFVTPIAKNLNDPGSAFLIVGLPTDPATACLAPQSALKWLLVHLTDSASTDPVTLPITSQVLPLYGATGALAGLVAMDTGNHLNFYADETFANPTRLLANVGFFYAQEAPSTTPATSDPTFAYLTVLPAGSNQFAPTGGSVYKIDSSGALSTDLYDYQGAGYGLSVADQGHAYFLDTTSTGGHQAAAVIQISQGVAQTLYTFATSPTFQGDAGQHLIFLESIGTGVKLESLAVGSPGTPSTIGTYSSLPIVTLLGGDVLVTHGGTPTPAPSEQASTELLDAAGTALRPQLLGSAFISSTSPALMVNHIPDPHSLAGGEIDVLDLSQPASSGTPLKLASGATYALPSGTDGADLHQVTATVGIGSFHNSSDGSQNLLEYDLSTGVVTPISLANTTLQFTGF